MDKMNYQTSREKIYYQLGYCAGHESMSKEILGYIEGEDYNVLGGDLEEYIEFEEKFNKDMLEKLQKKLKIDTLDGSMAKENLVIKEKE